MHNCEPSNSNELYSIFRCSWICIIVDFLFCGRFIVLPYIFLDLLGGPAYLLIGPFCAWSFVLFTTQCVLFLRCFRKRPSKSCKRLSQEFYSTLSADQSLPPQSTALNMFSENAQVPKFTGIVQHHDDVFHEHRCVWLLISVVDMLLSSLAAAVSLCLIFIIFIQVRSHSLFSHVVYSLT